MPPADIHTDESSIDSEESGDRKLVLEPVFWHGLEQPAAEKKKKQKNKHTGVVEKM